MSKLSTKDLKKMISVWLSAPDNRQHLSHLTDRLAESRPVAACGDRPEMSAIDYTAQLFEFRTGCTVAELEEHIWKLWCDGSRWKRVEKQRLGASWPHYLSAYDCSVTGNVPKTVPGFEIDTIGDCDMSLVEKHFNDPKLAVKCTLRVFEPNNQLADNYRLHVITTAEDDAVIGWTVFVD